MSTLLDSLRRAKQAGAEAAHPGATARQVEAILAALGYARRQPRVRVVRYAVGGLVLASVAMLGWAVSERSASIAPDGLVAVRHPAGTESVAPESRADDAVPPTTSGASPPRQLSERGRMSELFAAALALQRAGDLGGAITEYQTLLSETAGSAQVYNNLGLLYRAQDRLDDAAREFEHAIAIDPRYSKARNNLGVVRMYQTRHEDAAAAFREARRLDGTNLDAWVNLALAVQAAGDPVAAQRTLVDALSIDARHGPTHYNLARLFELSGDVSRAIEHYERFVEYSGAEHAEFVATVRDRIAALGGAGSSRY